MHHPFRILGATALFALVAFVQEDESRLYPTSPGGPPPPTEVADSEATSSASMKAYEDTITGTDVTFRMTPIRGGSFRLGSPPGEPGRRASEGPQVDVTVSPFWMGVHEVTWDEYAIFMESLDRFARSRGRAEAAPQDRWADAVSRPTQHYLEMDHGMGVEGYPAICMTQFAAKQYTKWLSMKTGRFYRLPTEAEWEFAARAGSPEARPFEAADLDAHCWWFENSDGAYRKVGTREPNPWGLHDMHGNVAEWCLDAFSPDGYADLAERAEEAPLVDPIRWPEALYPRVVRGGHWDAERDRLRSAARRGSTDDWKMQDPHLPKSIWYLTDAQWLGFRIVRPLNPPPFEEWGRYHDADLVEIEQIRKSQR